MLDDLTITIKTIHRPWCCARLIQSIERNVPGVRIHVLDDGRPEKRLSAFYPADAQRVNQLIETEFDIGISAGRNRLLETVETPYFLLIDDDHVVVEQSDIPGLVQKLRDYGSACDLLAALSNQAGKPRCFAVEEENRTLRARCHYHRQDGDVYFCDIVPNTFVAKTNVVRDIGWDESLKVREHWEFFYRAWMEGLKVAISTAHRFDHRHIHNADYNHLRSRSWYLAKGLKKHGLTRFVLTADAPDDAFTLQPPDVDSQDEEEPA